MGHIKELRKVLLICAYAVAAGTVAGWVFSDVAYRFLAEPIMQIEQVSFITITPLEPILVKLKVSFVIGICVTSPIIIWQVWSFVLPALKKHEKKYLYIIVPSSLLLFIGGVAFAFLVVLPTGLKVLMLIGGEAVPYTPLLTKSSYLNFILTFILTFGLVFQLPVVLLLLIRIGLLNPRTLAKYRKWAFFFIIILAVLVSPTPDLPTQFLLAGPMYLLYEISIWLGLLMVKRRQKQLAGVNEGRGQ